MLTATFATKRTDSNVFFIDLPFKANKDWEQWVLLRGDAHHDNPKCNQKLEKKHLEQARERAALILDNGDLFCAMQGKYDPRSDKGCLRPEHQNGRYLDSLVETAAEFYAPYADLFAVIAEGNHETAIKKRHETNLTERLVALLNAKGGNVMAGQYVNWVRLRFDRGTQLVSKTIWMNHGYGGGGPVTKDSIQFHRQMAYVRDADFIVTSHTHDAWNISAQTVGLSQQGSEEIRTVEGIKTATYKEEYRGGAGWHVETGKPPKPIGAYWLRFYYDRASMDIASEVVRAK